MSIVMDIWMGKLWARTWLESQPHIFLAVCPSLIDLCFMVPIMAVSEAGNVEVAPSFHPARQLTS